MTPPVSRGRHNRKKKRTVRRRLPMRYLLPSLLLVALLAMLMLRGYVHSEILADHRIQKPAPTYQVPDKVLEGGPVIDARAAGEEATSLRIPEHKIVLTFDDGPDPVWTRGSWTSSRSTTRTPSSSSRAPWPRVTRPS